MVTTLVNGEVLISSKELDVLARIRGFQFR